MGGVVGDQATKTQHATLVFFYFFFRFSSKYRADLPSSSFFVHSKAGWYKFKAVVPPSLPAVL